MFSSCENLAIYLRQAPSVLRQGETQHWTTNRQNENVRNPAANHHEPLERASPLERKHGSVCIDAISSSGYESITFLVVNLSVLIQHIHLRACRHDRNPNHSTQLLTRCHSPLAGPLDSRITSSGSIVNSLLWATPSSVPLTSFSKTILPMRSLGT